MVQINKTDKRQSSARSKQLGGANVKASVAQSNSMHMPMRETNTRENRGTPTMQVTLMGSCCSGWKKQRDRKLVCSFARFTIFNVGLLLLMLTPAGATDTGQDGPGGQYSQPLTDDVGFRPIVPKDINLEHISRNVFTPSGQYRVFEPIDTDLRAPSTVRGRAVTEAAVPTDRHKVSGRVGSEMSKPIRPTTRAAVGTRGRTQQGFEYNGIPQQSHKYLHNNNNNSNNNNTINGDVQELENLLTEYVQNFFNKGQYEPKPELVNALQQNATAGGNTFRRPVRQTTSAGEEKKTQPISVNKPRAVESGRFLFFAGLKKVLWPVFMGLQILKSLLFALFLPTLIGSVGKLLGKGIISGSAPLFIRPMEAPQDVDFKDNSFNFDEDNKFSLQDDVNKDVNFGFNQAEESQNHNQYAYNAAAINQQALSRYGNEQQKMQDSYLSALQSIGSASFKNSNSISGSSSGGGLGAPPMRTKPAAPANMNTFQTFQKVPASSLLLSNYDPFYSPLLSRLDSVFAQLKLNSENEVCREKLICLMYSNPAKYAPYSNLVSAQLSRELNELRKPTSDNPDILRFFKYMRAAKDGQDGVDCEQTFDGCKEFKDFENPAMVSTYHDINKLVQARKMTSK